MRCLVVDDQPTSLLILALFTAKHDWRGAWLPLILGGLAALAVQAAEAGRIARMRSLLAPAAALGIVFVVLKASEYADLAAAGISFETHAFFTFHMLLTGFHAAHVLAGIVLLALVGILARPRAVETGAAFWHMVDLVWVLLFPVVYLL